jgi:hypothetical protein
MSYWANVGDDEACIIIETVVKRHDGEIIDRVIDKSISEGADLDFPEFLEEGETDIKKCPGGK